MARRRTTIQIDDDLLRAAKVCAARNDLCDSDVMESALRRFLGLEFLESIWERTADIDAATAKQTAYDELTRARADRSESSRRSDSSEHPVANG